MKSSTGPNHVVVDGSNIATEGRSLPSLAQLSEAVMAFMEDYPDTAITVVVDATFGHRIDKKEVAEFEEGIANNELVAPPAGAVGRGDAFVLSIAKKAHSSILSNDSFQEFHGDYDWLFDEGRLIGGKPVPHVGWVFVDRTPVRGPVSRKATGGKSGGRRKSQSDSQSEPNKRGGRKTSAEAMEPMPVPKSPPPRRAAPAAAKSEVEPTPAREKSSPRNSGREQSSPPKAGDTVNELMPFLEFVEHHPVGTDVEGIVDSYSSHGAYIAIGDDGVRGYVPLRLMAKPTPTSARKVMKIGDSVKLVVVSFAPVRRSIDCAVPDLAAAAIADARAEQDADADTDADAVIEAAEVAASDETPTKRPGPAAKKAAAKKAPAKKAAAKKVPAKKAPAKKVAAKKAAAKKAPATKAAAKKVPAKKAPATKAPVAKTPAKKVPATKVPAKKLPAVKQAPAKKVPAKKVPAKKAPATKAPASKAPAKKAPATKVSAAKAPAKKTAAKAAAPSTKATRPAPKGR